MYKYLSIDIKKCCNCRICELWCSLTKTGECGPAYSSIQLYSNEKEGVTIPIVCQQCKKASCIEVCSVEALKRDPETGIIFLDYQLCTSCKECISACPFDAIFLQPNGKIIKCDLCKGLIEPQCALHCPKDAIIWGKSKVIM